MVGNVNVTAEKVIFLDIDGVLNDEGDRLKKGVYIEHVQCFIRFISCRTYRRMRIGGCIKREIRLL